MAKVISLSEPVLAETMPNVVAGRLNELSVTKLRVRPVRCEISFSRAVAVVHGLLDGAGHIFGFANQKFGWLYPGLGRV